MRVGVSPTILRESDRTQLVLVHNFCVQKKKLRFRKLKIKTMLILFFDSGGVVHKNFVPEDHTVTKEFYLHFLGRLLEQITRARLDEFQFPQQCAVYTTAIGQQLIVKKRV